MPAAQNRVVKMFNWPYHEAFRITKLYGTEPPSGVKYSTGKHAGIDLVGISDKVIRAVAGGVVYRSAFDEDGWGKYVVVKQDDGLYAIYCHLSKSYKSTGQAVRKGDMLGIEGATGQVTGQHLHFEIRREYGDKYSTIDPAEYLGIMPKIGVAKKAVDYMIKKIKIDLNGKTKEVEAVEVNGNNFVKLQDLRDDKIIIGYADGKPSLTVK